MTIQSSDNSTGMMHMSAGDQLAPESLRQYADYLTMLARGQIGPKYRARIEPESIVNHVLFAAYREHNDLRGCTEEELLAWMRHVLQTKVKDSIRFLHRNKRDIDREVDFPAAWDWDESCSRLLEVTAGWTSPSMNAVRHECEFHLAGALARLPDAQRDAIELHHLQGCTLAETAETMDRTVGSVVGLLRRGLSRLREILEQSISGSS